MTGTTSKHGEMLQLGTFKINNHLFGVDILRMREIIRPLEITRVPKADQFMEGVINLRGIVIPIISLRAVFGLPRRPFDRDSRIINMEVGGSIVGFIIDSIDHVRRIAASDVEPPPPVTASVDAQYVDGVARLDEELLILLNVDKLVSVEVLQHFEQQ